MRAWYEPDRERFNDLAWEDFKDEMKDEFLPKDWEDEFRLKVIDMRHRKTEEFREFMIRFERANMVLRGTRFFLEGQNLTNQLEAAACDDLRKMIIHKKELAAIWTKPLSDVKKLREWRNEVILLDRKRMEERSRIAEFVAAANIVNKPTPSSSRPRTDPPAGTTRLPKLTDAEKTVLSNHNGCFKCRKFYANHKATDCKNPWPDAKTYKTITEADGLAAQAKQGKTSTSKPVASIMEIGETIAAIRSYSPLAATTGVLDTGTDSDEYVKQISVPHIIWPGLIHNENGPTWPRVYDMLINCGSPSVLIDDDLVSQLELRRRKVTWHVPPLGDAWGKAAGEDVQPKEWVKLKVSSPCNTWTAVTVRAYVAPSLCAPVLLGRSWLKFNKLSGDHENDRLIHNPTGLDILRLPKPSPQPIKLSPKQRREERKREWKEQMEMVEKKRKELGKQLNEEITEYLKGRKIPSKILLMERGRAAGERRRLNLGRIVKLRRGEERKGEGTEADLEGPDNGEGKQTELGIGRERGYRGIVS
ncbi:hypothetical protein NLI96_g11206 [Meripilus lineatus]|uniref:Uncharacterized protein n=1 Tax=Meripilus lineatus TaxID=2056292 RepID=A0AAD5UUL3_9APHY|nr:hypothetical protein NLI96_g11206 [Physisporinus lineatus]